MEKIIVLIVPLIVILAGCLDSQVEAEKSVNQVFEEYLEKNYHINGTLEYIVSDLSPIFEDNANGISVTFEKAGPNFKMTSDYILWIDDVTTATYGNLNDKIAVSCVEQTSGRNSMVATGCTSFKHDGLLFPFEMFEGYDSVAYAKPKTRNIRGFDSVCFNLNSTVKSSWAAKYTEAPYYWGLSRDDVIDSEICFDEKNGFITYLNNIYRAKNEKIKEDQIAIKSFTAETSDAGVGPPQDFEFKIMGCSNISLSVEVTAFNDIQNKKLNIYSIDSDLNTGEEKNRSIANAMVSLKKFESKTIIINISNDKKTPVRACYGNLCDTVYCDIWTTGYYESGLPSSTGFIMLRPISWSFSSGDNPNATIAFENIAGQELKLYLSDKTKKSIMLKRKGGTEECYFDTSGPGKLSVQDSSGANVKINNNVVDVRIGDILTVSGSISGKDGACGGLVNQGYRFETQIVAEDEYLVTRKDTGLIIGKFI